MKSTSNMDHECAMFEILSYVAPGLCIFTGRPCLSLLFKRGLSSPLQVPTASDRTALLASYMQSCNDLGVGEQGCQLLRSLAKTYQV